MAPSSPLMFSAFSASGFCSPPSFDATAPMNVWLNVGKTAVTLVLCMPLQSASSQASNSNLPAAPVEATMRNASASEPSVGGDRAGLCTSPLVTPISAESFREIVEEWRLNTAFVSSVSEIVATLRTAESSLPDPMPFRFFFGS